MSSWEYLFAGRRKANQKRAEHFLNERAKKLDDLTKLLNEQALQLDLDRKLYQGELEANHRQNIVDFTLRQLGLFRHDPADEADLPKEERDKLFAAARDALENKAVQHVADWLVKSVKDKMLLNTDSANMIYDRFTINGVWQFMSKLHDLAAMAEKPAEEMTDDQKFAAV